MKLFDQGARQATVAHSLRASRQSVSEWWLAWRAGDTKKLKGATEAGRRPRVQPEQLKRVEQELLRGARANGYETDLWSLPRIARLIKKLTGVSYHPGHVWKILQRMGWSLQRPAVRARERDEQKVAQWKSQTWEEVKKKLEPGAHG